MWTLGNASGRSWRNGAKPDGNSDASAITHTVTSKSWRNSFSWQNRLCPARFASLVFFPRRLDPVRDRRPGGKDAVVPPEMPTRGPIGEAVLDDQSHGGPLDPEGVTGLGQGQV